MKKIFILSILLLLLASLVSWAQDYDLDIDIDLSDSFETEEIKAPFSLYGYLVNYSIVNIYTDGSRIEDADTGNTLYMRLKGDFEPEDALHFHFEAYYSGSTGNQSSSAVYESYAIDHLWGSAAMGPLDLQFGKMPIAWGTGYVFNPTARTTSFAFMETVSEETPGTLGIAPSVQLGPGLALQGYLAFQDKNHIAAAGANGDFNNLPFGIKLQATPGLFDFSAGFITEIINDGSSYSRYYYLSSDFAGAVRDFGVYGEAALRFPGGGSSLSLDYTGYNFPDSLELAAGFDYNISGIDVVTRVEYYHHGPGVSSKNDYDVSKVLSRELMLQGEEYIFLMLERVFFNYLTLTAGGLVNLNDFSAVIYPGISYELYSNFLVSFG
ncbi:MAG: hypothetical protein KAR21_23270, partial [Spirochaetales bacterium]|nr:hypothetical protein [Spirochaetales bacterium]